MQHSVAARMLHIAGVRPMSDSLPVLQYIAYNNAYWKKLGGGKMFGE